MLRPRYSRVKLYKDAEKLLGGKGVAKRVAFEAPGKAKYDTDAGMIAAIMEKLGGAYSDKLDAEATNRDRDAADEMLEDYLKPQPAWKVEDDGSTPKTLRDAGFNVSMSDALGDQSLEGDEPADQNWMTADESKQFYNDEADRQQKDFDTRNPSGIDALKGSYATPGRQSMIDKLTGNTPEDTVGPMTRSMKLTLMRDSAGKRESDKARLLAEQDARVKNTRGIEAEARKANRVIDAAFLKNQQKVAAAEAERKNPRPLSGRKSAALQETDAMTALRGVLERLEDDGKTETREYKRIAQELSDLRTNISKDPETAAKVAQAKKVGAEVGLTNSKAYFAARDVVNNVKDIDSMISRLQATDDSTLGFLTNLNLLKNRVMAKAGNQDALKKVNDAEMINSLSGKEVFELIKALGIGARGLDTPAERKFLREVLTGTNELTKETLLEMAMERRKIQIRNVEKWNKGLKEGLYERFYSNTGYMKRPLEVPGPAPVFAPTDISGEISKMNAVQLNEKAKSATADEKEQINLRLGVLGF